MSDLRSGGEGLSVSAPQPVDYDALIAGAREEADVVGKTNAWRLLLYCADAIETLLRQKR